MVRGLTGNQGGKAWPCPLQGGTLAAPVSALRAGQGQPLVPARPPLGTLDPTCQHWPPLLPPTSGLTGQAEGVRGLRPPAVGGLYLFYLGWAPPWDPRSHWPGPGPPLSAHLGYGTSLLTGLPAFSLSQSQLLLHTAARVSSLKHKPEHVIPPHKGKAPRRPWDRWEGVPKNRPVPPPGVPFSTESPALS